MSDVRVGSKTEVAALRRDVCFAPVSGHRQAVSACPKKVPNPEVAPFNWERANHGPNMTAVSAVSVRLIMWHGQPRPQVVAASQSAKSAQSSAHDCYDRHQYSRWFRAPLPAEPAHRSLGAAVFEADGQSRDRRLAVGQAAHQCARANSRRADCNARRQRDGRRIAFFPDPVPAPLEVWRAEMRVLGWIEGRDYIVIQSGFEREAAAH